MQLVLLKDLEGFLAENRPSREARKMTRGIESLDVRYAVLDEASRAARALRSWAEAETEKQRTKAQAEVDRLTEQQTARHSHIADLYRRAGVKVEGTGRGALDAAWAEMSATLAQQQRDAEILGEDHRALMVDPLTGEREKPSVLLAREIRERLHDDDALQGRIDRRKADLDAITVYAVDEEVLEWEIEFSRKGMVRDPNDDGGRPRLDPGLVDRLREVGIPLGEDDRQ